MPKRKYTVSQTEKFADHMRMMPTATENRLHHFLTKALSKTTARVHSQHIIGPYIADLYISYSQLIIEADGASHAGRKEYDERREAYMKRRGYRTLRFQNIRVWQDIHGVTNEIIAACGELKPFTPGDVKITFCPPMYAAGHRTTRSGKPKAWRPV